jgi:type II secretory pathway component GspD/PulD (secretin)
MLAACLATGQDAARWKTGIPFRQQLDEPVGISWQDRPLRDGLNRVAQAYGVAIFLDRRIDPGQAITATVQDQPLEAFLKQVAAAAHLAMAIVGPVDYLGPPQTASQLATLAALRRQDATKLGNEAKARLLRVEAWQWDELAQPRQLLEELCRRGGVKVASAEAVPLDMRPAVSLPPLIWTDRLTLLLAGFGLTFEIDEHASAVRLVPAPAAAVLEKKYAPRGAAADLAAQLRRLIPDASIRSDQGQLVVAASQEDHDKIERLLSGQSVRTTKSAKAGGEKLYSLQVANEPAGKVVAKLATSLGKELKYDAQVRERLKQPVKLELVNATLDGLLESTLKPLGLSYRLTPQALEIIELK